MIWLDILGLSILLSCNEAQMVLMETHATLFQILLEVEPLPKNIPAILDPELVQCHSSNVTSCDLGFQNKSKCSALHYGKLVTPPLQILLAVNIKHLNIEVQIQNKQYNLLSNNFLFFYNFFYIILDHFQKNLFLVLLTKFIIRNIS